MILEIEQQDNKKETWQKPELEVCQLEETQIDPGSGEDFGSATA